ncbi:hypothetical protein GCM10022402_45050 [Salinactinospora qingdaonensis]|uniref:Uncharacterized protein n=1 Tax=Salinactinospora qingdaonensis TaxID=702744 RepID=A0ABP7GGF4_9ACTN
MGEDSGLARTGPGDNEERATAVADSGTLGFVQTFEERRFGGHVTRVRVTASPGSPFSAFGCQ